MRFTSLCKMSSYPRLSVKRIAPSVTVDLLRDHFAIIAGKEGIKQIHYKAWIEWHDKSETQRALNALQQTSIAGQALSLSVQAGPHLGNGPAPAAAATSTAATGAEKQKTSKNAKTKANVAYPRSARPLVDIGANLTDDAFRHDLDAVLQRAFEANVAHILLTGTSIKGSRRAVDLATQLATHSTIQMTCTAGIHPHSAQSDATKHPDYIALLTKMIQAHPKQIIAVGECGLDYNRDFSPRDVQRRVFREQMALAELVRLPVFLHCRDAHDDFLTILKEYPTVRKCVHCYTDPDAAHLADLLALDCFIGITGWVADDRRGLDLQALIPQIPLERLFIETDAPYLMPRNMPKPWPKQNEPALLPYVAMKVAECYKGTYTVDQVADRTTANARDFFALDSL